MNNRRNPTLPVLCSKFALFLDLFYPWNPETKNLNVLQANNIKLFIHLLANFYIQFASILAGHLGPVV